MASAQLILSMVIDQFFFFKPMASFSDFVDDHPKSCWSILDAFPPLISHLWKYDLLIFTVFRKCN